MRQLDWERETPKMMAARKNGNNVIEYRSPLFSIRGVLSAIISDGATYTKYNPLEPNQKDKTPFGIITTIKSVSKSAVERNKVRTRFKEAMRLALTRTPSETQGDEAIVDGENGSSKHVDLPAGESSCQQSPPRS
jgi:ribonuclease P protein component